MEAGDAATTTGPGAGAAAAAGGVATAGVAAPTGGVTGLTGGVADGGEVAAAGTAAGVAVETGAATAGGVEVDAAAAMLAVGSIKAERRREPMIDCECPRSAIRAPRVLSNAATRRRKRAVRCGPGLNQPGPMTSGAATAKAHITSATPDISANAPPIDADQSLPEFQRPLRLPAQSRPPAVAANPTRPARHTFSERVPPAALSIGLCRKGCAETTRSG